MKFGTFLLIEACDRIGYKILIDETDNSITFKKGENNIMTFVVKNTNSFSDEFYGAMRKNHRLSNITSEIHYEIKNVKNNPTIMKRWKTMKIRNSNLNKIFS